MKKNNYSFLKTVLSSTLSKSRIATRITSDRFGYMFILTNSSIPSRYISGTCKVINLILKHLFSIISNDIFNIKEIMHDKILL